MQELQTINIESNTEVRPVVSSRTVAEELNRDHGKIIRGLENILTEPNVDSLIIPNQYKDKKGELRKEYLLTKDGFTLYMFNIQGHNNFKMAYINKFNEMEQQIQNKLPGSYKEALTELIVKVEENEKLQLENNMSKQKIAEFEPKASYLDSIYKIRV